MIRLPPRSTRTYTLFPYTTLFRSLALIAGIDPKPVGVPDIHPGRLQGGAVLCLDYLQRERKRSARSEEHTSELQSLMRNSYAVFCLKKKKTKEYTKQVKENTRHKKCNNIPSTK